MTNTGARTAATSAITDSRCVRLAWRSAQRGEVCQNDLAKSHAKESWTLDARSVSGVFGRGAAARSVVRILRVAGLQEHSRQRHAAGSLPRLLRRCDKR